jgi:hypothetical protein
VDEVALIQDTVRPLSACVDRTKFVAPAPGGPEFFLAQGDAGGRAPVLMPGFLHMTMLEPLATDNPRALPQQSISSVTNIDDLEDYLTTIEKRTGKSFLRVIDLPQARGKS